MLLTEPDLHDLRIWLLACRFLWGQSAPVISFPEPGPEYQTEALRRRSMLSSLEHMHKS